MLVELGADKEAKDIRGDTPLHRTAQLGQVEALKALVLLGADKEAKDDDGWTPLHRAASRGQVETVKVLLQSGVDIEAKMGAGWTPLHMAAVNGHMETVKVLVEAGADTNVTLAQMLYPLIYHPAQVHLQVCSLSPSHTATPRDGRYDNLVDADKQCKRVQAAACIRIHGGGGGVCRLRLQQFCPVLCDAAGTADADAVCAVWGHHGVGRVDRERPLSDSYSGAEQRRGELIAGRQRPQYAATGKR